MSVAIAVVTAYLAIQTGGWYGALIAAGGGFASGVVATGSLQGGIYGAFSGALFYGVGSYFQSAGWAQDWCSRGVFNSGLNEIGYTSRVLASGIGGGVISDLQGGKFGSGFISAGVSSAVGPAMANVGSSYGRVTAFAILGGTSSALAGGKFANGAVTAAFSYAFSSAANRTAENRAMDQRMAAAAAFDPEYAVAFESSPYLRATVPGQVSWDNAVTSWENGEYGYAAVYAGSMLAEQGMYVASLGQSFAANGAMSSAYVTVSRWGRPGLEAGDWVMKGEATWWNYARSGKWDFTPWNEFAKYSTGQSYIVPANSVILPQAENWFSRSFKGYILGQRQYFPGK